MKHTHLFRRFVILTIGLLISHQLISQEFSNKYGKVTDDELAMTTYANDTTATAVILYKKGYSRYEYFTDDFRVDYDVEVKIKILKHEGTEYANVTIPYYNSEKSSSTKELISGIDASAYNLENGKMVRTKMKKEYIFRERLNDNYMQIKFSIPSVKVGTVIEYKYKVISDFYYQLESWEMQQDIPVVYNHYQLSIPEYFKFNFEIRGGEKIDVKEKSATETLNLSYNGRQERLSYSSRILSFTGNVIPALKADSYVWCPDDYKSQVHFELDGLDFPGSVYRPLTTNWEKIDDLLLKNDDFGKLLNMRNPLREEMQTLSLDGLSTDEKIATLFAFLKQRVSWNEEYALFGKDIRKSIKEGTANNAVLNFILISMLRDANIKTQPIIMNRRNRGIIPYSYPSINKINTFVVGVQNTDSTMVLLDGSITHGYTNVLPPVLLTQRARIISSSPGDKWISPVKMERSTFRLLTHITITEDGEMHGDRESNMRGQYASIFRQAYKAAKDSLDYIEKEESENEIKVTSYNQQGVTEFIPEVSEKYTFTKQLTTNGDYIYINPMIFKHISENPFTQETRELPVEFPHKHSIRIVTSIKIPGNYVVDELPVSGSIALSNNNGLCKYVVHQADRIISLSYQFVLNQTLFPMINYKELQEFFKLVADKNNEMIVLKKVSQ